MKKIIIIGIMIVAAVLLALHVGGLFPSMGSPDSQEAEEAEKVKPVGPAFNADSAYAFCAAQCNFGPRVMNSPAHDRCGEWIVGKFKEYGCTVTTQRADLKGYDGTVLKSTNIMASYNPKATTRISVSYTHLTLPTT